RRPSRPAGSGSGSGAWAWSGAAGGSGPSELFPDLLELLLLVARHHRVEFANHRLLELVPLLILGAIQPQESARRRREDLAGRREAAGPTAAVAAHRWESLPLLVGEDPVELALDLLLKLIQLLRLRRGQMQVMLEGRRQDQPQRRRAIGTARGVGSG